MMEARLGTGTDPCPPTVHRHAPAKRGAGCAFYSPGRPGDICGRTPVASYTNPRAKVYRTWRCASHDRAINQRAAADLGYRREAVAR